MPLINYAAYDDIVKTRKIYSTVFCLLALLSGISQGQESFWDDPSGGSWFDGSNWSGGVPSSSEDAVFNNDENGTVFTSGSQITVDGLRVRRQSLQGSGAGGSGATADVRLDLGGGTLSTNLISIGREGPYVLFGSHGPLTGHPSVRNGTLNANDLSFFSGTNRSYANQLTVFTSGVVRVASDVEFGWGRLNANVGGVFDFAGLLEIRNGTTLSTTTPSINISGGILEVQSLKLEFVTRLAHNSGTLTIDGGTFDHGSSGYTHEAANSSSNVLLNIKNGATWDVSGNLVVADSHAGHLSIHSGSSVTNAQGRISNSSSAIGSVTVDGAGSNWINTEQTRVGQSGTGTLTISNGGAVSGTAGVIGAAGTGDGEAQVTGDGSSWNISGTMVVAENGLGMLRIENGGEVSNQNGSIGFNSGSNGSVIVDGAGSTWTNNISLYIGGTASSSGGTGTLTIRDEGNVTVVNDVKLWNNGTLNLAGGTLNAASFDPTLGTFDWTDGTLAVEHYSGSLMQSAGTLAPGSSPGVTTINGDYTIESNGTLEIELFDNDGASPVAGVDFDQLVSMEANLAGTLNLVVDAGYIPTLGDIFPIVSASGGVSGTFDMVFGDYLGEGLGFDIQYNATDVTLEVVNMLPGDFDGDLDVDGADFLAWQRNDGTTGGLTAWQDNYGAQPITQVASLAVPEPSATMLTVLAAMCFLTIKPDL